MLKWLSEGSRLFAITIIFATLVTAQAQSRSNNPIILTVKPDVSLSLGSDVVIRHGLVAALEAATNGNKGADFNRIFAGLDDGSYDCIASGTTITPARRKLAEFCAPYA
jgi:hypothetical protein